MKRSVAAALAAAAWCFLPANTAEAGAILDRVKRDGILHCAALERPGYAAVEDGKPVGRAADLCRSAAEKVLGPNGRFALRLLDLDSDFAQVRDGKVELAFLEPRTIAEQHLDVAMVDVGLAYSDRFAIMLPENAAPRSLADLNGQTICFMIGDPVWPTLEADLRARDVVFRPFGFSEEVEMKDAYNVGRCSAIAGLASTLDEVRDDAGVKHLKSRLLAEVLGDDRVDATMPLGDADWGLTMRAVLVEKQRRLR